MKSGKISRSIEKPIDGFIFKREGYNIYISYIEPGSISKIDVKYYDENNKELTNTEYEYIQYEYCGCIINYEELVNKSILLKYTIESELSLIAKGINNPKDPQYVKYREFVSLCKEECNKIFSSLGLNKNEI